MSLSEKIEALESTDSPEVRETVALVAGSRPGEEETGLL